ncbi:DUF1735 domain-containing protein [Rufibacter ruber]|uniref:DUF1735 domain-containing protein n=1 Tax=Rufibacter ruber TaxID=1783499 RepID=UPI00082B23F5|nr:DUF1735 domain-containing protein [Rufibacter ruber]
MIKYSKLFTLALFVAGLTSCLNDPFIEEEQKYGMINEDAFKVVEFPTTTKAIATEISAQPTAIDLITINLAASEVANEDIKVTLKIDPTKLPATRTLLPTNFYTLPNGLEVVIPAGSRKGVLKATLNTSLLNPAVVYGLPLSIANVDKAGYTISGNYGTNVISVSVKNKYDGVYRVENIVFRHSNAAFTANTPRTRQLRTLDEDSNESFDPVLNGGLQGISFLNAGAGSYFGNFSPVFNFDLATNNVVSVDNYYPAGNASNRSAKIDPTGVNKMTITPTGDKTLEVSYIMVQAGVETLFLKEKWIYTGPRP